MTVARSVVVLIAAVIVTIFSVFFISLSINSIRSSIWFDRIMERIDRDGPSAEHLSEAAEYARRPGEWRRLVRIAWEMPDDRRWTNVADLATLAADRFPRDDTWIHLATYANIRRGRYDAAAELISDEPSSSRLAQNIQVLIAVDRDSPRGMTERLADFAERDSDEEILVSIGRAARDRTPERLYDAGEKTGVSAYYLQSALTAAKNGDRTAARRAVGRLQGYDRVTGGAGQRRAEVYLAAWLRDTEWFFDRLAALGGRRAVTPPMLLMQADFLVEQGQFERASPIYREVQQQAPATHPVAFGNDAAIQRTVTRFPDNPRVTEQIDATYRRGIQYHPEYLELRLDYAAHLVSTGRRIEAIRTLLPLGPLGTDRYDDTEPVQAQWLLTRTILGSRTPVERLEADLWDYLNQAPDAHLVARFLARFFVVRQDDRGLSQLRERYTPQRADWAATLHAIDAAENGDYAAAAALFEQTQSATALYNHALFSLRHESLDVARERIDTFQDEAEQIDSTRRLTQAYLLQAEHARMNGEIETAEQITERATALSPYSDTVYTYQAILARLR
ncbi:MAG: hypothetical protein PF508_00530 [Spirochaeta sp.]|jgi:hypothetical protein|nr:hypothetical protein [Spirochaeta sp.]